MESTAAPLSSAVVVEHQPRGVLIEASSLPLQKRIVGGGGGPNKRRQKVNGAVELVQYGP